MKYEISTDLIVENFNGKSECPLCEIKKIVERGIAEQFLNDAVMEDHTRAKVNELGFCDHHFDMLFSGPSKLSLALQISTRLITLNKKIDELKSFKMAKKQAETLRKARSSCIICEYTDFHMVRYYKTVAQMFFNEPEFRKQLEGTNGFCLRHYEELLKYADYAKSSVKDYLEALFLLENRNMARIIGDLKRFCDKHDYRNRSMPLGDAENVLSRSRVKLYGDEKNDLKK